MLFRSDRQHGLPEFRIADLSADAGLLQQARQAAEELLDQDPTLEHNPLLLEKIRRLFQRARQ